MTTYGSGHLDPFGGHVHPFPLGVNHTFQRPCENTGMRRSVLIIAIGVLALLGMHGVAAAGPHGGCLGTVAGHHAGPQTEIDLSTAGFTLSPENPASGLACLAVLIGFALLTRRRCTVLPMREFRLEPVTPRADRHVSRGPPDRSVLAVWRT